MASDGLLALLIGEKLNAQAHSRRAAAGILLDALRAPNQANDLMSRIETARAREGPAVGASIAVLISEYGLANPVS